MAKKIQVTPIRSYKNEKTMMNQINKKIDLENTDVSWMIAWTEEGRCFPIFFGMKALQLGIHFQFNTVAVS